MDISKFFSHCKGDGMRDVFIKKKSSLTRTERLKVQFRAKKIPTDIMIKILSFVSDVETMSCLARSSRGLANLINQQPYQHWITITDGPLKDEMGKCRGALSDRKCLTPCHLVRSILASSRKGCKPKSVVWSDVLTHDSWVTNDKANRAEYHAQKYCITNSDLGKAGAPGGPPQEPSGFRIYSIDKAFARQFNQLETFGIPDFKLTYFYESHNSVSESTHLFFHKLLKIQIFDWFGFSTTFVPTLLRLLKPHAQPRDILNSVEYHKGTKSRAVVNKMEFKALGECEMYYTVEGTLSELSFALKSNYQKYEMQQKW